jgi:glycosyltransferase 2 family protein
LPSTIGGDTYKFLILSKRWSKKKSEILSSVLLERLIGISVTLPFPALIGWIFLGSSKEYYFLYWGYLIFLIVLLLFVSLIWFVKTRYGNESIKKINSKIPYQISNILGFIFSYRNNKGIFFALFSSVLFYLLSCYSYQLCFMAYGQHIDYFKILNIVPMLTIASAIPISINGLGVKEGLSVFLFTLFGISIEVALAVSLTARILLIVVTASGGIGYLFMGHLNVSSADLDASRKMD